jgi:hypothetical protein
VGQIQNGHRGKAAALGATGLVLVAANLTSAMLLYRWCSEADRTCRSGGESRREEAIMLRRINIVSLVALLPWYVYGVWDARAHHSSGRAEHSYISLGVDPSIGGGQLVLGGRFSTLAASTRPSPDPVVVRHFSWSRPGSGAHIGPSAT